jgi:hypothetical protein
MPAVTIQGRTYEEIAVTSLSSRPLAVVTGLSIPKHDYIGLSYTGSNLTGVVYKLGGTWNTSTDTYSGGTTVGQLELVYDGSNNLVQVVEV